MVAVDVLAGAAVGYLVRKARRADESVDEILDAGTDRVCELIEAWLGGDPVLGLLDGQTRAGTESQRTLRRAEDAIAERLEADEGFRQRLELLLAELERPPGGSTLSAAGGVAAVRDVTIRAEGGGVAAGVMGSVTVNPRQPDPIQA